jgi:hypothetical protein
MMKCELIDQKDLPCESQTLFICSGCQYVIGPGCACSEIYQSKPLDPTIQTPMDIKYQDDYDNQTMESPVYPLALQCDDNPVHDNNDLSGDDLF